MEPNSLAKPIRLNDGVSTDDISNWGRGSESLLLRATRNSKFATFCEGVALGKVSELGKNANHFKLFTTFHIFPSGETFVASDLGILGGLFGLSVVFAGASVIDPTGSELRTQLLGELWNRVQDADGLVGDAKKRCIVFRDPDYSIPKCLREGDRNSFPHPQLFKTVMKRIGAEIGTDENFGLSLTEDDVITFLYEAARNSHEHAREDLQRRAIHGIRGITVEKYIFGSSSEIERADIPPLVRKYFRQALDVSRRKIFLAFSVTDLGPGIQNTLPVLPSESAWDRLNRAFMPGQSRKPTGNDINRGLGLKKMLDSARRLRAFVFVRSAELVGYLDFSDSRRDPTSRLKMWPGAEPGKAGTSVSMVWPIADRIDDFGSFGVQ